MNKLLASILNIFFIAKKTTTGAELIALDGLVIFDYRASAVMTPKYARKLASELSAFADIAERGFFKPEA